MTRRHTNVEVRDTRLFGWLLVVGLLSLSPLTVEAQETRTQTSAGASMRLPDGWQWTSKFGDTLAIMLPLEINGREEKASGELYTSPNTFVGTRVDEIRLDVERNKDKNFKVQDGKKFAKEKNVAIVTYVKERGSDPVRKYQRTHYLWRRQGMLYEWREEFPLRGGGKARSGLASAQRTMKFTTPKGYIAPDKERDYVLQRARFKLPPDWVWTRGATGEKVRVAATRTELLFQARSEMLVRGERWALFAGLLALKSGMTVRQLAEGSRDQLLADWEEVEDLKVKDKVPFRGEKAHQLVFTGVNERVGTKERLFVQYFFFKHKGHLFVWQEFGSARGMKDARKALKKVRKGLRTY